MDTITQATHRQLWAIFCATGYDVRNIGLSIGEASSIIDMCKNGNMEDAIKMLEEKGAKKQREKKDWNKVWQEAHEAGMKAGSQHKPQPMIVSQHEDSLNDASQVKHMWYIEDGVCGFVWIELDGRSSFAKWAVKHDVARKGYSGTVIWVHHFNQSYERKMKYAEAVVDVLRRYNIKAYHAGRLD